jgi:hypothetical protein
MRPSATFAILPPGKSPRGGFPTIGVSYVPAGQRSDNIHLAFREGDGHWFTYDSRGRKIPTTSPLPELIRPPPLQESSPFDDWFLDVDENSGHCPDSQWYDFTSARGGGA